MQSFLAPKTLNYQRFQILWLSGMGRGGAWRGGAWRTGRKEGVREMVPPDSDFVRHFELCRFSAPIDCQTPTFIFVLAIAELIADGDVTGDSSMLLTTPPPFREPPPAPPPPHRQTPRRILFRAPLPPATPSKLLIIRSNLTLGPLFANEGWYLPPNDPPNRRPLVRSTF